MNKGYFIKQRLLGVAVILFCIFFGILSDLDMSIGVICIPLGLVLIVSKERLVDIGDERSDWSA